ncbi:hypothetical protein HNQ08_002826 [Deinococcus humi]|uniref:Uncharacterized protein n=1 Tax=Deinococcus humi TaxID=662880 RepID=A0A7W8NFH7_9DEIO|nr:hypothetical protein [Deinococcus humi]
MPPHFRQASLGFSRQEVFLIAQVQSENHGLYL